MVQLGLYLVLPTGTIPKTSQAFSIAVMQTANFNNIVKYKGYNNYSSFAEQWAEEVSKSGDSIDGITR